MDITREQFVEYERIRLSGVTNMFAVGTVSDLTGLGRDEVLAIQSQYTELTALYPLTNEEKQDAQDLREALLG